MAKKADLEADAFGDFLIFALIVCFLADFYLPRSRTVRIHRRPLGTAFSL